PHWPRWPPPPWPGGPRGRSRPAPLADHGGRTGLVTRPPSARMLQRVPNRLHPDLPVPEDERVDPVLDLGRGGRRGPLQEEHVAVVDLRRQRPVRVGHVGQQLGEPLADAVLASLNPVRGDEDRVVGVVLDDPVQVTGSQGLGVVLEDFLRAARHRAPPSRRDLRRLTLVSWISSTSVWSALATSPRSR